MSNDLISVIIPCYNHAHFLGEAIESVLAQTYTKFELIVVDDGSTDNTFEIASKYREALIIQQKNKGLSAARNTGLKASKGEYVVFLDADDRLLHNALAVNLAFLQDHPECGFSSGHVNYIGFDGSPIPTPKQVVMNQDYYKELLLTNYIGGCPGRILFKRSIFESIGHFNPSVNPTADYDLYLRVTRNFPIYCHDEIVAEYRQHGSNMSLDFALMLKMTDMCMRFQRRYIKKHPKYRAAYRKGIKTWHAHYGKPLILKVQQDFKNGREKFALSDVMVLVQYYPQGVIRALFPNVYAGFFTICDAITEAIRSRRRRSLGLSTGTIMARPQLIPTDNYDGTHEKTRISWTSRGAIEVEVRIGAPDGPLFSRLRSDGESETGNWVKNGMLFFLQDVSGGLPLSKENTLSIVRVIVCAGKDSQP
jgi:glycosyltransferase involved in cell wall biosynthesis